MWQKTPRFGPSRPRVLVVLGWLQRASVPRCRVLQSVSLGKDGCDLLTAEVILFGWTALRTAPLCALMSHIAHRRYGAAALIFTRICAPASETFPSSGYRLNRKVHVFFGSQCIASFQICKVGQRLRSVSGLEPAGATELFCRPVESSAITSNPAIRYHFKTGQRG